MRAVIQRVGRAEITIDHRETRSIGQGLVVFLGVMKGDTDKQADFWQRRYRACVCSQTQRGR